MNARIEFLKKVIAMMNDSASVAMAGDDWDVAEWFIQEMRWKLIDLKTEMQATESKQLGMEFEGDATSSYVNQD